MSTITIECKNKTLTIVDSPSIEIGGVNSIQFSFCPLWDGYNKTVHFYKDEATCYPVEIVSGAAQIPSDLVSEGASFFFFVDGVSGENSRRSQIFKVKIESSLLVVENADTDVQLRLIDLIENIDTSFDYSDMTDEDKLKLREGLSAYQKKLTYHLGLSAGVSSFTLPDENYREGADIVSIHLAGIYLHEGLDYTLSGRTVTLKNPIVHPSVAEISIIRAIIIDSNDYSLLKGEKGDKGEQGIQGVGVDSVVQTTTSTADSGNNVVTVTLSNGQSSTFNVKNGSKGSIGETGATGNGISSITVAESSADSGNNVITINMTDGTKKEFIVKNGSKGSVENIANYLADYLPLSGGTMTGSVSLAGATMTKPLVISGGDSATVGKIIFGENGQITNESTATLVGRIGESFYIGHSTYPVYLRGKNARPYYNNANTTLALSSDIPSTSSFVPTSRTVNGKSLSADITLSASDVGASASGHGHSWSEISDRGSLSISTSGTITASKVYGAVFN